MTKSSIGIPLEVLPPIANERRTRKIFQSCVSWHRVGSNDNSLRSISRASASLRWVLLLFSRFIPPDSGLCQVLAETTNQVIDNCRSRSDPYVLSSDAITIIRIGSPLPRWGEGNRSPASHSRDEDSRHYILYSTVDRLVFSGKGARRRSRSTKTR